MEAGVQFAFSILRWIFFFLPFIAWKEGLGSFSFHHTWNAMVGKVLGLQDIRSFPFFLTTPSVSAIRYQIYFPIFSQLSSHSQTLGKADFSTSYVTGVLVVNPFTNLPLLPPASPCPPPLPSWCSLPSSGLNHSAWMVTKILCNVFTQRRVRAGTWLYSAPHGPPALFT